MDRYQGQQNDYIILSLVRTKTVGHLRDVRRLVVAMSRARLGLYILARVSLFHSCSELQPAFNLVCVAAFVGVDDDVPIIMICLAGSAPTSAASYPMYPTVRKVRQLPSHLGHSSS